MRSADCGIERWRVDGCHLYVCRLEHRKHRLRVRRSEDPSGRSFSERPTLYGTVGGPQTPWRKRPGRLNPRHPDYPAGLEIGWDIQLVNRRYERASTVLTSGRGMGPDPGTAMAAALLAASCRLSIGATATGWPESSPGRSGPPPERSAHRNPEREGGRHEGIPLLKGAPDRHGGDRGLLFLPGLDTPARPAGQS